MRTRKGKISVHKRKSMKRRNRRDRINFFNHVAWKRRMDDTMKAMAFFP